jgi:RNA polymerase sigma-70 factor (ECF subfamily)
MSQEAVNQRLSQISTAWSMLCQAHEGAPETMKAARRQLMQQYGAAVYRYLLAAVRSPDAADELYQEFALRFVRGDFKSASPDRGRFRSFLKTSLYHLIVDHQRRQKRQPVPLSPDSPEPAVEDSQLATSDQEFLTAWRAELLGRAWKDLARFEGETGQPLFTVLRLRADHPDLQAPQMAEQLVAKLGKAVTPEWIRKRLHLARAKFADYLLAVVVQTLETPSEEELEHELIDLGLLDYCRSALERRGQS